MTSLASQLAELLSCPSCSAPLVDLSCANCKARYPNPGGIPNLRRMADRRTEAVRQFYEGSPFPNYPLGETLASLRGRSRRSDFARRLDESLPANAHVAELGCGTGQMSLFLATGNRLVVAADLSRRSLEVGAAAARRFGIDRVLFVETDLRAPGLKMGAFDLVYSSGVLHHTPNPRQSFASMAKLVRPGGWVVLGLYNAAARIPHRLRRAVARLTGYRRVPFDPVLRERSQPARRIAWFRDQYQHPEEHRHTIGQVRNWFQENGVKYLRCYPSVLIGGSSDGGSVLFSGEDDWWLERLLAQASWIHSLSKEGGLFLAIGSRPVTSER